jgi:hypothetical protein
MKRQSRLLPFLDLIRQLKADEPRIDCRDIRDRLQLPATPEMVRKFCHRHGVPVNPPHAKYGAKNHAWKGGRILDKDGYVLVRQPDHPHANSGGYVREHRLVMEAAIGRYLDPSEVVHHVDDQRQNNQLENLVLYPANGAHLAATLKGRCPRWSQEGRRRTLEGVRRARRLEALARAATRGPSEIDADPSR